MTPFRLNSRQWRIATLAAFAVVALAVALSWSLIRRVYVAATLFDRGSIVSHFTHMAEIFPSTPLPASTAPRALPQGVPLALPPRFSAFGKTFPLTQYLRDTGTDGLIVLQDGNVVFEQYYQGHDARSLHISWSLAKSMISAMLGIAVHEGAIHSVQDPVDRYAPSLKGTAYEGIPLKDVMQMSSGVAFNENYDDDNADVVRLARTLVLGGSFNAYAKKLKREFPPGTHRHYSSFDTQVLAMVLEGATGKRLPDYMRDKLWQPLGAEHEARWLVDSTGMAMGFGGLNAVLRDYARFGQMYLDKGRVGGRQVVPAAWIRESLTMDAPHLLPQAGPQNEHGIGYGYQWWIPEDAQRDFMGIGVYNQFIYVAPSTRTVIVKQSANFRYTSDDFVPIMEHLAMFRAIAAAASGAAR